MCIEIEKYYPILEAIIWRISRLMLTVGDR